MVLSAFTVALTIHSKSSALLLRRCAMSMSRGFGAKEPAKRSAKSEGQTKREVWKPTGTKRLLPRVDRNISFTSECSDPMTSPGSYVEPSRSLVKHRLAMQFTLKWMP